MVMGHILARVRSVLSRNQVREILILRGSQRKRGVWSKKGGQGRWTSEIDAYCLL